MVGYLAFLVGAFIATSFRQPAIRGLDAVAFVFAVFFALVVYVLTCISIIVKFAERWGNLTLVASATGLIGFFSGAAWVLWLHGDPSRILLIRTIP